MLTVSQITRRLGINRQTLYFYERTGLIPSPQRSEAGYRLFSKEDLQRLSFIINAKKWGLSLNEIKEILKLENRNCFPGWKSHHLLIAKIDSISQQIDKLKFLQKECIALLYSCSEQINLSEDKKICCLVKDLLNT